MLAKSVDNGSHHCFGLLQYLVVPEAQHTIALRGEKRGPRRICAFTAQVLTAIDLNNDALIMASKVHKIGTNGRLSTKMKFFPKQCTQVPPKLPLGIGHGAAQLSRSWDTVIDFAGLSFVRHRRFPPPPSPPHRARCSRGRGGEPRELGAEW